MPVVNGLVHPQGANVWYDVHRRLGAGLSWFPSQADSNESESPVKFRFVTLSIIVCTLSVQAFADNWPRFRGPNGAGTASGSNVPAQWSQDDFEWKIALPGKGNSSPIVWGDTVYITCADQQANLFFLLALAVSDGKVRWSRDIPFEPMRVNPQNGFATSTPAADEGGVYAMLFGKGQSRVMAYSHDGEELWSADFGEVVTLHGPSVSPMVHNGMLVFSLEQEGGRSGLQGYWYALDCTTGETVWRLERDSNGKASSSVPSVYEPETGPSQFLFSSFGHGITAVNADTGKVLWEEPSALIARAVGSPVVVDDIVVAACGRRGGGLKLAVLRLDGDVESRVLHAIEERYVPYVPTPVASNGLLYTFADAGTVSCIDLESGEPLWSERLKFKFAGSPVLAGDKLYCVTMDGEVVVLKAGPEFGQLAVNDLGESTQATPAIANGRMFFRTEAKLMCVAGPEAT